MKIKILSSCRGGDLSLEEGQICEVPGDLSEREAITLRRLHRAEEVKEEAPAVEIQKTEENKPKGGKKK